MNKDTKRTLLQFLGAILLIVVVIGGLVLLTKEGKTDDARRFKEEYEALNNTIRKSDGATYGALTIDKENPIKYISAKEAIDVLESDSAIIYIGAPWCPWCRNAVPVLLELAKENNMDTIYYIELDDIKSNYEIENGQLKQTTKGTEDYYKLLDKLADHLNDYVLTDDQGKKYDTGEKRIYMPYVLAVYEGEIVGDKVGTVTLDEGQTKYDSLTEEQHKKLTKTYGELFDLAQGRDVGVCDDENCN